MEGKVVLSQKQRAERMARLTALAEQVWEDAGLAHEFLTGPQPQLDGKRPVELTDTDEGTDLVVALLMKIEYALPG